MAGSAAHIMFLASHIFSDSEGPVLLGASGCKWGKPDHEEVEARKGDEVDCKLPHIEVQLAWEPQAACDPAHGRRDQVVEISNSKQLETKALDCAQSQLSIHTVAVLK
ncbi:hypothetical protein SAY87_016464 [Trapa incisa]|uniref:Uncharacterized protein n=1 Tax=Trapa incisa TaxID=236973 RepID=A0AAN7L1A5_9MYRT|nr:hypothetical protein SAY87_016464 [Trapa incisa]